MEEKTIREICEAFLNEAMEYNDLPGLVIGVSCRGEEFTGARGVRDVKTGDPLQADDVFHCASVSKLFTSAAVMKLVEAGVLGLDDRLRDILPDMFDRGTGGAGDRGTGGAGDRERLLFADPRWEDVRLRQMLSHTAGIADVDDYHWEESRADEAALPDYVHSEEVTGRPLLWEPGKGGFRYSNIAFEILGYIVSVKSGEYQEAAEAESIGRSAGAGAKYGAAAAGRVDRQKGAGAGYPAMTYEAFVKRFLMEPAGMEDSTMATFERFAGGVTGTITEEIRRRNEADRHADEEAEGDAGRGQMVGDHGADAGRGRMRWHPMALPHEKAADRSVVPVKYYPYTRSHAPSSTLTSTAADLLRWARIHMKGFAADAGSAADTGSAALLSFDSYRHMQHEYAEVPNNREKMGLGWFMRRQAGHRLYGHEGTDDGFRASLWICPERDLAIVVLSNLSGAPVKKLNKKLFERIPEREQDK